MEGIDFQSEKKKLATIIQEIQKNIDIYSERKRTIDVETEELYNQYRSGDIEVYDSLMVNISMQGQITESLKNNQTIIEKPYFGRIDYYDKEEKISHSLYIGKHGVNKDNTNILIVDWRAPVSTIYYDCNIGDGIYTSVDDYSIPIDLNLKRTFDIDHKELTGFYDSAAVTDDELLISYLSKNKDAVLGDIITTIQQEQNQIIREKPFHNIIVQGVAGSGKTTVAIHRISYLLYNYGDRYKPSEFCILGSNQVLLNYITSGLPDLDVHETKQMQVDELLFTLLEETSYRSKYQKQNTNSSNSNSTNPQSGILSIKSTYSFINALDNFLDRLEQEVIPLKDIGDQYGLYMSKQHIQELMQLSHNKPITEKIELLDERLIKRIPLVLRNRTKDLIKEQQKKFKKYYSNGLRKWSISKLYMEFLHEWHSTSHTTSYISPSIAPHGSSQPEISSFNQLTSQELNHWLADISNKKLDIYDLAALALIKLRTTGIDELYMIKQIFIDEAQDFGISIYYVLKQIFYQANFTIMGDVSQNINYTTGLNDWEDLIQELFGDPKSKFYTLLKSYRNTIEISEYASSILSKTSFLHYPIEPIIRHGMPVQIDKQPNLESLVRKTVETAKKALQDQYETIAIICADDQEAEDLQKTLSPYLETQTVLQNDFHFTKGVQIIPIGLVKGLEFDVVILWNPNTEHYEDTDAEAKRLYVAVTRALHELYIFHEGNLGLLLRE